MCHLKFDVTPGGICRAAGPELALVHDGASRWPSCVPVMFPDSSRALRNYREPLARTGRRESMPKFGKRRVILRKSDVSFGRFDSRRLEYNEIDVRDSLWSAWAPPVGRP